MKKWLGLLFSVAVVSAATGSSDEKDVLAALDAWKHATMKKDKAALEKLLHADLSYTHSSGKNETKADVLQAVINGKSSVEAVDFSGTTVRVYGKTALVKGKVDITNKADGKSTTAHLDILHVLVKGSQGWQLVARQAVRLTP